MKHFLQPNLEFYGHSNAWHSKNYSRKMSIAKRVLLQRSYIFWPEVIRLVLFKEMKEKKKKKKARKRKKLPKTGPEGNDF